MLTWKPEPGIAASQAIIVWRRNCSWQSLSALVGIFWAAWVEH
jgi:hypothetical protein